MVIAIIAIQIIISAIPAHAKTLILGHNIIKAVQFEQDPEPDYIHPIWDDLPYHDDFHEELRQFGLPHKS